MNTKTKQWSAAATWLGQYLAGGSEFVVNLRAKAKLAGFTAADLAAAFVDIDAHELNGGDLWALNDGQRTYWRVRTIPPAGSASSAAPAKTFSAEDVAAAVAGERARCAAIVCSAAAEGRTALARHHAFALGSTLEEATKALNLAPLERSFAAHTATRESLAAHFAKVETPAAPAPAVAPTCKSAAEIFAARRKTSGH